MRCFILILSLLLAACATAVPDEFAFSDNPDTSLVLIRASNVYPTLQRVDLDREQFRGSELQLGTGGFIWKSAAGVSFNVAVVPSGDYALTKVASHGTGVTMTCYSKGTSVFPVPAGKVVSFSPDAFGSAWSGSSSLRGATVEELNEFVAENSGITADIAIAPIHATILFEAGASLIPIGANCPSGSDFRIKP